MYLSPHFTLDELTFSQTASREALDNTPSADVLANLKRLTQTLEQVRSLVDCPVLVSSGYRSPALNRRVGGAPDSAHTRGLAADLTATRFTPKALAQLVADSDLVFDQLILEYDRWVHLAVAEQGARRQILTIRKGTGYLPGLQ